MKVSVIIPVYNAEKFINKAVASALEQKQTKEIILVEDGSTDNSLSKCKQLEKKHSIVNIVTHPDNINKGAGASRNLGIEKAQYPYIAFLDADDYYLPGFFDKAESIFNTFADADGIFGSIGAYYYDEKSKIKHLNRTGRDRTGLNINYNPQKENLFNILLQPKTGHFSIIGMVIKKSIIQETGIFDTDLLQGEDTDFIWRLSLFCKLYGIDKDKIVAIRGVHSTNRVLDLREHEYYGYILIKKWLKNIKIYKIPPHSSWLILKRVLVKHPIVIKYEKSPIIRIFLKVIITFFICLRNPYIFYTLLLKNFKK